MLSKHLSSYGESFRTSEMLIYNVPVYAITGADVISRSIVRQRMMEIGLQTYVFVCYAYSRRTSLPYAHQPYSIDSQCGNRIPLCWRNCTECDCAFVLAAQIIEPHPGIDFVNDWSCWPCCFQGLLLLCEEAGGVSIKEDCCLLTGTRGFNQSETCAGCIVSCTMLIKWPLNWFKSTSLRNVALKAASVRAASYLLR